jgi:hypothetical protein
MMAWVAVAFIVFAILSLLFTPYIGVGGLFYAWLGTNIIVVVLGFFLALKEVS